jgi:BioD-like phosphotransacetylase family protein
MSVMTGADKVTFGLSLTHAEVRREAYVALAAIMLAAGQMENRQWD